MAEWKAGGSRDLKLIRWGAWDGTAAQDRMFGDGEEIDQERARLGHLIYDAEAPQLKGSYKLPFADVVDGELVAVDAGLRSAASRLPQTDAPAEVLDRARAIIDSYKTEEAQQVEPKAGKERFTETVDQALLFAETPTGTARRIRAVGITADVVNGNRRRYPRAVLESAVQKLNNHLHESAGQGRLIATGEAEHPSDKGGRPNILETVVKWEASSLDGAGHVLIEGVILPTTKGRDILTLVEHGIPVGVSMRGYGSYEPVKEASGTIHVVTELTITGFDLVAQPSDPNARIVESRQATGETEMNVEELLKLLADKPEMKEAIMQQLGLADKGALEEALKAKAELEERKRQEAIAKAIDEATRGLPYGELNKDFVEAVRKASPADAKVVAGIVETKRREWDAIFSATRLAGMGKPSNVQVLGPVFERETGQPEYTKAAFIINESLVKAGEGHRRNLKTDESPAGIYTARILEMFDAKYKTQLLAESKRFEEAEQTSDLNLPYSVSRTIIEEAYPELIAANVFDFGTADASPMRLYFEHYAGESGVAPAVANEALVAAHGSYVATANDRLRPGTVVVTNQAGLVTYTEGVDYVVDYEDGSINVLSTGAIVNGANLLVDYTYEAIRKGEMQPIQRAKNTLSYTTMTIAADRLATQISSEAVVFSRSQLGYDAVTRTMSNLVRQVRRKIDQHLLYKALAACLEQANNSGGTWTAANDPESEFVEYIGVAKTKVYNRYYVPTAIVMSQTNADRLSNWDGFKREGFPNAVLNAAGFAGSVKGLPIFASTEFSDKYVVVFNRELVAHRVYNPMMIKGPYPSYHTDGTLIGADQYYTEEWNGSLVPVKEKGAYMIVV